MMFRLIFTLLFSISALADSNTTIQSFSKAKKLLQYEVYLDHRVTLYCAAEFTQGKQVIAPAGFTSAKHVKRSKRIEWEHVVPAYSAEVEHPFRRKMNTFQPLNIGL